jgi:hypothetical protein
MVVSLSPGGLAVMTTSLVVNIMGMGLGLGGGSLMVVNSGSGEWVVNSSSGSSVSSVNSGSLWTLNVDETSESSSSSADISLGNNLNCWSVDMDNASGLRSVVNSNSSYVFIAYSVVLVGNMDMHNLLVTIIVWSVWSYNFAVGVTSDSDLNMSVSVVLSLPFSVFFASGAFVTCFDWRFLDFILQASAWLLLDSDWNSRSGDSVSGRDNFTSLSADNLSSLSVIENGSLHAELSSSSHFVVSTGFSRSVELHARADFLSSEFDLSSALSLWIFDLLVNTDVLSVGECVLSADRNSVESLIAGAFHSLDTVDVDDSPFGASLISVLFGVGNAFVLLDRGVLDNSSSDALSADNFISVLDL